VNENIQFFLCYRLRHALPSWCNNNCCTSSNRCLSKNGTLPTGRSRQRSISEGWDKLLNATQWRRWGGLLTAYANADACCLLLHSVENDLNRTIWKSWCVYDFDLNDCYVSLRIATVNHLQQMLGCYLLRCVTYEPQQFSFYCVTWLLYRV